MKNWTKALVKMGACEDAVEWASKYPSIVEAWVECKRGDWMIWLLGMLSGKSESDSRKKLVLTVCQCARLALPYVKKGEVRPLKAVETAEAWARGEDNVTLENVRDAAHAAADAAHAAADAADAAYAAAYVAYAAYAADAAAYAAADAAAYAAADAAYAAYAAADAASAAADAAAYAAADAASAAYGETLSRCADIVRENYPDAPSLE